MSKNDPKILTRDKTWALNTLETSPILKNKHYEIGLLWKMDKPKLPMNRELTEEISFVIKKIRKKPSIRKNRIKQYVSKGYARKLTQNEIRNTSDITNFTPPSPLPRPTHTSLLRNPIKLE